MHLPQCSEAHPDLQAPIVHDWLAIVTASCTYIAHHEMESVVIVSNVIVVVVVIIIFIIIITTIVTFNFIVLVIASCRWSATHTSKTKTCCSGASQRRSM